MIASAKMINLFDGYRQIKIRHQGGRAMKKLYWKRLIAGIGAVAMLAGNVADLMPQVVYAAEEAVSEENTEDENGSPKSNSRPWKKRKRSKRTLMRIRIQRNHRRRLTLSAKRKRMRRQKPPIPQNHPWSNPQRNSLQKSRRMLPGRSF